MNPCRWSCGGGVRCIVSTFE